MLLGTTHATGDPYGPNAARAASLFLCGQVRLSFLYLLLQVFTYYSRSVCRLGIAAKRDSDIPGLFILQDILTELPKLGSWAAADLTGYSFASSGKQRVRIHHRPLYIYYIISDTYQIRV